MNKYVGILLIIYLAKNNKGHVVFKPMAIMSKDKFSEG